MQVYIWLHGENYWHLQPGVFLLLGLVVNVAVKHSIPWGNKN